MENSERVNDTKLEGLSNMFQNIISGPIDDSSLFMITNLFKDIISGVKVNFSGKSYIFSKKRFSEDDDFLIEIDDGGKKTTVNFANKRGIFFNIKEGNEIKVDFQSSKIYKAMTDNEQTKFNSLAMIRLELLNIICENKDTVSNENKNIIDDIAKGLLN